MGKYKYEKFQIKAGRKNYILSQHDGDNWAGPAIEHFAKEKVTKLGIYTNDRKYLFEVAILNPEGNEYTVKVTNKDGYTNGPMVVCVKDILYFGCYYPKDGFNGIVYRFEKGHNVRIQEYKHGMLVDECLDENIIYENIARPLPFDAFYETNELVERNINNKINKCIEYIAGDPTTHQHILGASVDDTKNVRIGQYKNNAFNGLALDYSEQHNVSTIQFYDCGKETDEFKLVYSPEFDGYSFVFKGEDGNYTSLIYCKEGKKYQMSIQKLDKKLKPIGGALVLPNQIDPNAEKPYGPQKSKKLPEKDNNGKTAEDRLNDLIGLNNVKSELRKMKALIKKSSDSNMMLNMCFYGNPGTGKTEVARLIGEILYDEGILDNKKIVEVDASGLVAQFVGQTQPKTHAVVQSALGGVLFIDEAYTLASSGLSGEGSDFGKEAIAALLQDMETYRGKICIILAGYRKEMENMISTNPGFESRINRKIDFPDYNHSEIVQIAKLMLSNDGYKADDYVIENIAKIVDSRRFLETFANARDVRNVLGKLYEHQAERTINNKKDYTVTMDDINAYYKKAKPETVDGKTALERLNNLIGLDNVKKEIDKLRAVLLKNKNDLSKTSLHMCFYGNPGTGKTEVANLLANILYDEGILPTNKLITTDRAGLVGQFSGTTAIKTHKKVKEALGGVLFIDEAYSLNGGAHDNYGKEAIDALIQDMENYQGKFCVILAGYKNEMENMIAINPGFDSRINRKIDFPDYTTNELLQIVQLMVNKKKYELEDDAKTEVGKILYTIKTISKKKGKPFANAREVRNILESLYEIQALRTIDSKDDKVIKLCDVLEYKEDHGIVYPEEKTPVKKHNFNLKYADFINYSNKKGTFEFDVDLIEQASVNIKVEMSDGTSGEGSGFFITPNGIIGTCAHVVSGAEKIIVVVNYKTYGDTFISKDYVAELIACNDYDDTAIIGIVSQNIKVPFYPLKPEKEGYPKLMSEIVMGGYPFGGDRFESITITEGKVQSINKDSKLESDNTYIYVDLSGQPGSSGSGVINKKTGKCEGIFAGAAVGGGELKLTINYMIPIQYFWNLLKETCGLTYENECFESGFVDEKMEYFEKNKSSITYSSNIIDSKLVDEDNLYNEYEMKRYNNIHIVRGDVTTFKGDAIVNAANKYLAPGSGVCGAVFRGAGYKELELECRRLGEQPVGEAVITGGYRLPSKHIIHAVGPRYDVDRNPERLLAMVYERCFDVAYKNEIKTIAFPSISTGIYSFPIDKAVPIALREIMRRSSSMDSIYVYCFDEATYNKYLEVFEKMKHNNN